jgi:hypothetical protein
MIRAAKLDTELYEEIVVDHDYFIQSICVIILSSLSTGIACIPTKGILGLILVTIISLVCWLLWAYVTFFIANQLLPTKDKSVDFEEVIRITGFASTPGLIRIVAIIPSLFGIVFLISGIYMLIMMATAIKHAFDFDILRALGVSLIGGVIYAIILGFVFL